MALSSVELGDHPWSLLIALLACYLISLGVYHLYFSPIRHFPGPKVVAVTRLYEFYQQHFKDGNFMWKVEEWHKKYGRISLITRLAPKLCPVRGHLLSNLERIIWHVYFIKVHRLPRVWVGWQQLILVRDTLFEILKLIERQGPIIRISPDEIHINDPDYMDEIYAPVRRKRNKYGWTVTSAFITTSAFATLDHDLHRLRRTALNPFFSHRVIENLEPMIKQKVEKLIHRLYSVFDTGKIVKLNVAYMALTTDVITEYAFGKCANYLDDADFAESWTRVMTAWLENTALTRQFPWIVKVMQCFPVNIPVNIIEYFIPGMGLTMAWRENVGMMIKEVFQEFMKSPKGQTTTVSKTIFQELLASDLPPSEKSAARLSDEGNLVLAAGANTTAHTLTNITFHLLRKPRILNNVRKELDDRFPNGSDFTWTQLSCLQYLRAVINEGLRTAGGVTYRLPRIAPNEDLTYKGWQIPAGTPVSQTPYYIMTNPSIFPDPKSFCPERWLVADDSDLYRHLIPFGKGTRMCAGMTLAWAEMYLTIATLVRSVDLELFETDESDVEITRDIMVGGVSAKSQGLRVKVIGKLNE